MLWHHNTRVNSLQKWKQMCFRVCFHLLCELTSTTKVMEWQVSWNSWYTAMAISLLRLSCVIHILYRNNANTGYSWNFHEKQLHSNCLLHVSPYKVICTALYGGLGEKPTKFTIKGQGTCRTYYVIGQINQHGTFTKCHLSIAPTTGCSVVNPQQKHCYFP